MYSGCECIFLMVFALLICDECGIYNIVMLNDGAMHLWIYDVYVGYICFYIRFILFVVHINSESGIFFVFKSRGRHFDGGKFYNIEMCHVIFIDYIDRFVFKFPVGSCTHFTSGLQNNLRVCDGVVI